MNQRVKKVCFLFLTDSIKVMSIKNAYKSSK